MKRILILAILIILIGIPISYSATPLGNFFSKIFNWFGQGKATQPITPQPTQTPQIPIIKPHEDFIQKEYTPIHKEYISVAGISYEKVFNILKSVNPSYIDGITKIEFIKTNKQVSNSGNGWYYLDSKSIRVFVDDESDNFLTRVVLHELKHHYCLTKFRQEFDECSSKNNFDYCYHKQGCFLDTPIDREYELIK